MKPPIGDRRYGLTPLIGGSAVHLLKLMKLLFFLLLPFCALAQQRIYVNAAATGNNSGTRWADAHTDLHSALQRAQKGDTIWVAAGTYKPDTDTSRFRAFEMRSGIRLFGGFAGTETRLSERDHTAHATILSGDIGRPNDSTDNSYTILYMAYPDSSTVVDGLIFEHGNADFPYRSAPPFGVEALGGGIYIMGQDSIAYPDIRYCTFRYNYAASGGGVFINGSGTGSVAPRFLHCHFYRNKAEVGGGIYKYGSSRAERTPDFGNCTFLQNSAIEGSGIITREWEGADGLDVYRCVFVENTALPRGIHLGSGTFVPDIANRIGRRITLYGCTFKDNTGIIYIPCFPSPPPVPRIARIHIDSCTFDHTDVTLGAYSGTLTVNNCIFNNLNSLRLSSNATNSTLVQRCSINTKEMAVYDTLTLSRSVISAQKFFLNNRSYLLLDHNLFINSGTERLFYGGRIGRFTNNLCIARDFFWVRQPHTLIQNSVFVSTGAAPGNAVLPGSQPVRFEHCAFWGVRCDTTGGLCSGVDNISDVDLLFRDTAAGDYRLRLCSPLINGGNNAAVSGLLTDFAGLPRIQGAGVDIGPYEAPASPPSSRPLVQGSCGGLSNGRVSPQASAGCPPYTYRWRSDAGAEGSDTTGLAAGRYVFTITDARGETAFDTLTVPGSALPTPRLLSEDQLCGTAAGGSLTASLPVGVALPLRYRWSDNAAANTPLRSDLPPGRYGLTVTDALGCQDSAAATLARVGTLAFVAGGTPISCFGSADGDIWVAPSNGKAPFRYTWSTGQTDSIIRQVTPGTYIATITDDVGCTATFPFYITQPDSLYFVAEVQDATDTLTANGHIRITGVSGGTQPYGYRWSTGGMDTEIGGLRPGTYTATVTDQSGCTSVRGFSVRFLVSTGTALQAQRPALVIWPNPTPGPTHIAGMAGNRTPPPQRLRLWDAQGRLVLETAVSEAADGRWQCSVDLRGLPAGVYVAEAENGARGKVVLE